VESEFKITISFTDSERELTENINLMESIPLCDIINVYINIYLRLYTTIFHNSE